MIDTHCHIYDATAFPHVESTIREATEAGVAKLVAIGIDSETSGRAVQLAEIHPEVFATVGWHPTHAGDYKTAELSKLRHWLSHPKVLGVGEIGFDFHWDYSTPAQQEVCFHEQYELALELDYPMVYHCREAMSHMLERLDRLPPAKAVFHCFSGNPEEAQRIFEMGGYVGVDGPLTYPKAIELREIIQSAPRDRVVIETDAPYLSPQKFRGKPNSPALVAHVLAKLAEIWEISVEEADSITTSNAVTLFPKLAAK